MELPEAFTSVLDALLAKIYSLEPYLEPTVVLVPGFVRTYVQMLSEAIGFDVETLNYTLGLFLCYPLGMIMNALPYGPTRHLFSFLLGAFLMQFTLGTQWIHQLITSLIVYVMILTLPRKTTAKVVPIFVMGYCVLGHLHRQYISYLGWDLDFTGTQMVLTQKLYMLAYNLYDGEVLASGKESKEAQKCKSFALAKIPSFMEFMGYTFLFSNVLAGPAFEFSTYKQACDGSHLYDAKTGKPKGPIPSNLWPTLRPFFTSLVTMGLFVVMGAHFPLLDPVDPKKNLPVLCSPEFLKRPWHIRYAYMWMSLLTVRMKYYFAWKNAEGATNLWYAGFEGFDESGKPLGWDNSNNVNIWEFETAPNFQTLSKEWNKKTSAWLTRYVYIRTNGSLVATYGMSAFWHGFYPGYYLFFLSVPLVTFCERLGRKKISAYFSDEKWSPYGICCILVTSFIAEYMVSAFQLLALDRSWINWTSHYFIGHIVCAIAYVVLTIMPSPPKSDKDGKAAIKKRV